MAKDIVCKTIVSLLKDNSSKTIRRFASVPKLTAKELNGMEEFWNVMLEEVPERCACKFPKTKKNVKESFNFYRKNKVGKAAMRMAGAGVALHTEAKKCGII